MHYFVTLVVAVLSIALLALVIGPFCAGTDSITSKSSS